MFFLYALYRPIGLGKPGPGRACRRLVCTMTLGLLPYTYVFIGSAQYQEVLDVHCSSATLGICLKGQGVNPIINVSLKEPKLDLGFVMAGDENSESFKVWTVSI